MALDLFANKKAPTHTHKTSFENCDNKVQSCCVDDNHDPHQKSGCTQNVQLTNKTVWSLVGEINANFMGNNANP